MCVVDAHAACRTIIPRCWALLVVPKCHRGSSVANLIMDEIADSWSHHLNPLEIDEKNACWTREENDHRGEEICLLHVLIGKERVDLQRKIKVHSVVVMSSYSPHPRAPARTE